MKKKDSSTWSEIKSLDERLAREPDSFCFARLSEIYLKVGLVADALHTARQGVAKHPGYLAGQRALAMACNANGLHEESRSILEQVTAAVPEDTAAQKLLASLYVEAGDKASAVRAYTTLLDFRPDDVRCKALLEELHHADASEPLPTETYMEPVACKDRIADDVDECVEKFDTETKEEAVEKAMEENVEEAAKDELEEDIYELSEDDIVFEEEETSDQELEPVSSAVADSSPVHHDPLSTLTLAELYEQQGFIVKALDIYRTILVDDPDNMQLRAKITSLENQDIATESLPEQFETPEVADEPEAFASDMFESMPAPVAAQDFSPLVHNQADNVLLALDSLLENIRRIKACR
jgi:tetratricopeptide (TPR) repeat protein